MKTVKVVSLMVLMVAFGGCRRVDVDLSNDLEFKEQIGKQYRTRVEMGVYQLEGSGKQIFVEPFGNMMSLPRRDQVKKFPHKFAGTKILGVFPPDSEFKVLRIVQENVKASGFIEYYVEITRSSDQQWVGEIMKPKGITTYDPVPKFETKYVEEILN